MEEPANAGAHLLPEAGATQERTLEAVRCSALLGSVRFVATDETIACAFGTIRLFSGRYRLC